jgi:sugar O-acyltransferase (sialic acid O-acetyltransferase NeuD family)
MVMAQPVLILGTRLLAVEMNDLIGEIEGYEVAGFVENMDRDRCDQLVEGRPVFWVDDIGRFARTHVVACGLSTTHRRTFVEQAERLGLKLATLVHPTARVSTRATLGDGCFVSAMAAIATHTTLGRGVFVNRGALIGHHTTIGDFCTIQPGANIAGAVTLGGQTYVGIGAVVIERRHVGAGAVIGAGAVVTSDVPDRVLVVGLPAKVVKSHIDGK